MEPKKHIRKLIKKHSQTLKKTLSYENAWRGEVVKIMTLFIFVFVVVWCASRTYALTSNNDSDIQTTIENYSAIGIVNDISTSTNTIYVSNVSASDGNITEGLTFNTDAIQNIESTDYASLSMGDIKTGDQVVLQGLEDNNAIKITRIIDFSWNGLQATSSIATSTATIATSTDTDLIASTTVSTSTTISTDSIATSTATSTSTSTETDLTATTTTATTTIDTTIATTTATTTDDSVASSTDSIVPTESATTTNQ